MIDQNDSDTNDRTEEEFEDVEDSISSTKSESSFDHKISTQDVCDLSVSSKIISGEPDEQRNVETDKINSEKEPKANPSKKATKLTKRIPVKKVQERPKSRKQLELADIMRKAKSNMNTSSSFHLQTDDETNAMINSSFIKHVKRSGEVKLNNRNLSDVPNKLWKIFELEAIDSEKFDLSRQRDEDNWWNSEPTISMDLSSNCLKYLSGEIKVFGDLKTLYLFNNNLIELPNEIGELSKLTKLDASRNKLVSLSKGFSKLRELKWLNLSHNSLSELDPNFVDITMLEYLDLSYNVLKSIPIGVGFLIRLTEINLSHNFLRDLPLDITNLLALRKLDLSNNELTILPNLSDLRKIEFLYAGNNNIIEFPRLQYCMELKEIYLHDNYIKEIPIVDFQSLTRLKILDLHDNSLEHLPDEISLLQQLNRLNIQNNNLVSLPASMCLMAHLKSMNVDGNKFRSLRRDIIQCGTSRILKFLRDRYDSTKRDKLGSTSDSGSSIGNDDAFPTRYDLKYTKTLNLGGKEISEVPEHVFQDAIASGVTSVDLSKNKLMRVPERLLSLSNNVIELNLSTNKLTEIPDFLSQFYNLKFLDVSKNMLQTLPDSLQNLSLKELIISSNKFLTIPSCVYDIKSLEVLSVHDNKIEEIDVNGLLKLEYLATLDLANNNISKVPPELGKMTQLRALNINGNNFRQPRYAVLAKGTESVLSYLRDRIPL